MRRAESCLKNHVQMVAMGRMICLPACIDRTNRGVARAPVRDDKTREVVVACKVMTSAYLSFAKKHVSITQQGASREETAVMC